MNLRRPTKALTYLFSGKAKPEHIEEARKYLDYLEQAVLRDRAAGETLAYAFCAPDALGAEKRDFTLTVSKDLTCHWRDEQGRAESRKDQLLVVRALMGNPQAARDLKREQDEYTIVTTISEKAYWMLIEKDVALAQGREITEKQLRTIDHELAPFFWRDVNQYLPTPLVKKP